LEKNQFSFHGKRRAIKGEVAESLIYATAELCFFHVLIMCTFILDFLLFFLAVRNDRFCVICAMGKHQFSSARGGKFSSTFRVHRSIGAEKGFFYLIK
jgi:hypothetical protein